MRKKTHNRIIRSDLRGKPEQIQRLNVCDSQTKFTLESVEEMKMALQLGAQIERNIFSFPVEKRSRFLDHTRRKVENGTGTRDESGSLQLLC